MTSTNTVYNNRLQLSPKLSSFILLLTCVLAILVHPSPHLVQSADATAEDKPEQGGSLEEYTRTTQRSVREVERELVLAISHQIDLLVEEQLAKNNETPNPTVSDDVFVRRIYLDIVGRIPTIRETEKFFNSNSANKRAELIDQLLDSYGYVSRQYNFFADLFRAKSRLQNNVVGQPYIDFIKDSLEANKPYDQFVRELLTSEGHFAERGNGAVGYYLRDFGMPEDNMSNTVRVFLGTRLECAQCHDHPFDKWTQRQYFEMVAFTGGIGYRDRGMLGPSMNQMARMGDSAEPLSQREQQSLQRVNIFLSTGIFGSGTGLARLPEGFMGEVGKEFEIIKAKAMFGNEPTLNPNVPRERLTQQRTRQLARRQQQIPNARPIKSRQIFADWITSPDNPRFAQVIANRMWKQAMGLGLVEPVDILEDNTVASNPALLGYLTQSMVDLNFDLKQFLRAVYNSQTYQSEGYGQDIINPLDFNFNGPVVRRMSAEQIWDSLLVLMFEDIDLRATPELPQQYRAYALDANDIYEVFDRLRNMSAEDRMTLIRDVGQGGREAFAARANRANQPNQDRRQLVSRLERLDRSIDRANRANEPGLVKELQERRVELQELIDRLPVQNRREFSRASELPSPAPASHFLREFGQSDREEIENANVEPSVMQVLSLMNGYVEQRLISNRQAALNRNIDRVNKSAEKIETAFLTMLQRRPSTDELRIWQKDLDANPNEGIADLIWTICNSNEFIFIK
ncbi:MAG TPA: DUF1549 domain-containing protein [Pirellulaceae bacterium]|nr:DUF1549 domain-containing protein [Pirellulaceae bacterium]HMO91168.1 DUF1549 domain-containing protein [Pirellulaceae bacterium]HMP69062.1 DUF1549 domain-containing protein [Pirellulaceae bacterium]